MAKFQIFTFYAEKLGIYQVHEIVVSHLTHAKEIE